MRKIFFVTNVDWFFLSHRLPLAMHAKELGYEVFVLAKDTGRKQELTVKGIHFIDIPFERSGRNPWHELKCVYHLFQCYRKYKPDIIHQITLKAVLLGSLAAKMAGRRRVLNALSGLGYNFTDGRNGILQWTVRLFIRVALKGNRFSFILQNPDDKQMVEALHLVPVSHIYLIRGAGVDLCEFDYAKPPEGYPLHILFPARILLDKGVMELLRAAQLLEAKWKGKALFLLAGDRDKENLAVLNEDKLRACLIPGYIEWLGHRKEMLPLYWASCLVVLPSYREGLPKALIEACAVGRPIVTTDVPGCRECVKPGYNGLLVPAKNAEALAKAVEELLINKEQREVFGKNSRLLAEAEFSIDKVIHETFAIYETLLSDDI